MSVTISTSSALIRPNISGQVADLLFRETDLLNWFRRKGLIRTNDGGAPYLINLKTGTTTASEIFTEGAALPATGRPSWSQASLAPTYLRAVGKTTGHLRDQNRLRGFVTDPKADAIQDATAELYKLTEATLCGSGQDRGIASAIDATDVYGTLDPGVVTLHASLETAVGGALTITVLDTMYAALVNTPRGAKPTDVLTGINLLQKYINIGGPQNATALRAQPREEFGSPYDMGIMGTASRIGYNGADWSLIRTLVATELYMLDVNAGSGPEGAGIEMRMQRDLEVEPLSKTTDDDAFMASHAYILAIRARNRQGKLTGAT
jgi:hypothetical protein